ncbi:MAG: ABC transporter permease [Candidatus Thiodiazotropha sp. (ex Lucinoma aequizonata)]|nr:ABC transporter permease [Candidatus Thiodiazotropha sp. (ex Lucinoma aequizonata)]MCU7889186.1 ABC transporter permease [Candidatus Thiodiazotropha sp. (ex Lucinoma aequizonata)]MCU7895131.1 ABC transporter permease [Candidatus Thiodiazotropha sp. (ex Lucinoma aequizonata)]MCU7900501.1 ABC transporter permease [Candidatus Thiodiazotropha sp. (ex Lucinoma aequizonata)]MCU7900933.1 ABC transporter permease [Candidatus Thiodiazotropha sp. (ex Lucinoma aequizonata)]
MNSWQINRIAFQTIVTKEVLRFLRIWVQTILPPAITTTLYFVIFGKLIGDRIGEMDGYRYIDFIVPGIILMSVIQNSYANVVSSFFGTKLQHYIEELLIAPVPNWVILAGYVVGGVARGTLVGIVVTMVSLFFTDLKIKSYVLTLLVFVLTSMLFALAGFINAVYAKSFDDISIVPTFVLTPLTYLGGIFYSIQLLPDFWQKLSLANPILYMVNTFRFGILGVSDIDVSVALVIILGFITLLIGFSLRLLSCGVGIKD